MFKIGIDTGGTHTDVVLANVETGETFTTKVSTTPDLISGLSEGIDQILTIAGGLPSGEIRELVYGTTIVVNMIAQQQLENTALITTKGFRDVLEIGRAFRDENIYDIQMQKPPCLIERRYRYEVTERIDFKGNILTPIHPEEVRRVVQELRQKNIQAVAICFLHSYINPAHEMAAKKIFEQEYPEAYVSLSSEINPQFREYERTSTTAINAAMMPNMVSHLKQFRDQITHKNLSPECYIMQANAGVASFDAIIQKPVFAANSGPIAGIISSNELSREIGIKNIITFDMGGTSTDVCLIENHSIKFSSQNKVEGYPISIPAVELSFIGAGGGSIAWIDPGGALKVGPKSQGAFPGPVCYGRGGTLPTVTDANLVTGRIRPEMFLQNLENAVEMSKKAILEQIARPLNLDLMEAAEGILQVVNSNMIRAIRKVSVEKGYDPGDFSLLAYGGAGPIHAARVAEELDIPTVLVPFSPGTFSAQGLLMSDCKYDFVFSNLLPEDRVDPEYLQGIYMNLKTQAGGWLEKEGVPPEKRLLVQTCDIRYYGQSFELNIPVPSIDISRQILEGIKNEFNQAHARIYGHAMNEPLEFVNYRVSAIGHLKKFTFQKNRSWETRPNPVRKMKGTVIFDGSPFEVPIFERTNLAPGFEISGPAIICEMGSTTIIYPGQSARIDPFKNIIVRTQAAR